MWGGEGWNTKYLVRSGYFTLKMCMEKFTSQTYMYISLTGLSLGAIVATDFPQTTIYDRWTSHKQPTKMRRFSGRLQELSNRESLSKRGPDTEVQNMSYVFDVGTERGHVVAARKRSQIGVFHWPQTILKQLQEWHVIVSCDQLGETLRAVPTLPMESFLFTLSDEVHKANKKTTSCTGGCL